VAVSLTEFAAELRAFTERRAVVKRLSSDLRKLLPPVRRAVRQRALATLPSGGGLNEWVAAARVTLRIRASGRTVRAIVKGNRNSARNQSDLNAIDRGRVRAPSWGRRGPGQWHTQAVPAEWFTGPATEWETLRAQADAAFDAALDEIRRG
jgi:hypothetical protein